MKHKRTTQQKDIKFLSFRVSVEFWTRVKFAATRLRIPMQDFCIEAIERAVDRAEKKTAADTGGTPARTVIDQLRKNKSEK